MAGPTKKKQQREERTDEEALISRASSSQYNVMMPMVDAAYVRLRHPVLKVDLHMSTKSDSCKVVFEELCAKGLREKLVGELRYFAEHYDPKWNDILVGFGEDPFVPIK
mgnify:FL=1